jgi:hypothetical protein
MRSRADILIVEAENGWIVREAFDPQYGRAMCAADTLVFNNMGGCIVDKGTLIEFLYKHFNKEEKI